ncbi:hypothetical protein DDK01_05985 [Mycobacteroides abscessus]|nr:hypothetical protein [Mycobacteroides abscessus]PVA95382.1 hypothetical protein DDK01_05985 [Mycobacteroides abscessus]
MPNIVLSGVTQEGVKLSSKRLYAFEAKVQRLTDNYILKREHPKDTVPLASGVGAQMVPATRLDHDINIEWGMSLRSDEPSINPQLAWTDDPFSQLSERDE